MLKLIIICSLLSSAFADEVLHFKATYTIPTVHSENTRLMTFELEEYTATKRDVAAPTKAQLSYVLPARMTGIRQTVEMELMVEELPRRVFMGPTAVALCEGVWKEMKCQIRFTSLQYSTRKLAFVLRQEGVSESEVDFRLSELKKFAGDPVGFTKVVGQ